LQPELLSEIEPVEVAAASGEICDAAEEPIQIQPLQPVDRSDDALPEPLRRPDLFAVLACLRTVEERGGT
jgi:hypothetical protein